jgi:hypothetical protein
MKINTRELRSLYQEEIRGEIPDSRSACPLPRQVAALFGTTLSRRKRMKIMHHIVHCGPCLEELESWYRLFQHRERMIESLCSLVARRNNVSDGKQVDDSKATHVPHPPGMSTFRLHRVWSYALLATLIIFSLFLVFGTKFLPKNSRQTPYRASLSRKLELVHPSPGKSVSRELLFFQWKPMARADSYILEIYNEALAPVWKSPELVQTRIAVPACVRDRWPAPRLYFWLVTAVLADGQRIESDIGFFYLK